MKAAIGIGAIDTGRALQIGHGFVIAGVSGGPVVDDCCGDGIFCTAMTIGPYDAG